MYATYLAEIGYQMLSNTGGRDKDRAFMVDAFDPANNKIRVDLAFASAGAVYGMEVAAGKSVSPKNIDQALIDLLQDGNSETILNKKEAEEKWSGTKLAGYSRWMHIFKPNVALKSYLKH